MKPANSLTHFGRTNCAPSFFYISQKKASLSFGRRVLFLRYISVVAKLACRRCSFNSNGDIPLFMTSTAPVCFHEYSVICCGMFSILQ